ncbi:conserved hypothetical protein [Talaromyces stipitatus ATCC 10500]|uniref:Xylanolytic transcriptional activator regulatory domain-containing protein n=1 Tax=Talaromyces stipitatus (strain ATCC 10500 / CBS 375.48 / QM 6759 / NRRL 1006) TaxID=441959 RepID=B8M7V7_TALSN|nr:uncharacterized protein TSTA_031010 [Talaromyces stipitatus ATCC 10500]EED19836.1 conserved hypothetical protein [Talaromyces stipitatus ATCC 10500]
MPKASVDAIRPRPGKDVGALFALTNPEPTVNKTTQRDTEDRISKASKKVKYVVNLMYLFLHNTRRRIPPWAAIHGIHEAIPRATQLENVKGKEWACHVGQLTLVWGQDMLHARSVGKEKSSAMEANRAVRIVCVGVARDMHPDHIISGTEMDFPGLLGLPDNADSCTDNDGAVALFPESQIEFGMMSDIQTSATALVQSSEIHSFSWPSIDIEIGTRPIPDGDDLGGELSPHTTRELYQAYFDQTDHSCYMLDKNSFLLKMDHLPLGPESLSLKFIVLAHGASASPAYRHLQNKLYDTSRRYFENAETGNPFMTIAALQACILLAVYELKQLFYSRAWGRVNRAMWMAEMFGLHKMDAQYSSPRQRQSGLYVAPTTDPEELEERRRTFWSVFILCCFTSISVGWNTYAQINYMEEITTLLPNENRGDDHTSPFRPTLNNTLRLPMARKLSSFEALIITSALHIRSLRHADFALVEIGEDYLSYDFWMHHYYITESISQVGFTQHVEPTLQNSMTEPATLCVTLRIQAIYICLHHAAVVRESQTNSTRAFSSQSETKCLMAAMKLTSMINQIRDQAGSTNPNPYTVWSIYVAAQFYVRELHASRCKNGHPIMPMRTPSKPSLSPNGRPSLPVSASREQSKNMNISHFDGTSPATINNHASGLIPSRFELLHNIDFLLSTLSALKRSNPMAGTFEAQIYDELKGGKAMTDDRPIGRVEFPLDGKYVANNYAENGAQDRNKT